MPPQRRRGVLAFVPGRALAIAYCALLTSVLSACSGESTAPSNASQAQASATQPSAPWMRFEGETAWAGHGVHAQLRPLVSSEERRDFDSAAWRLKPGHIVWSLQISMDPTPGENADLPGASTVDLATVGVQADGGLSLHFLNGGEVPSELGVYDPVRVLLGPPAQELAGGQVVSLALVGPSGLQNPKLSGLPFELALSHEETETAQEPRDIPILDFTGQHKQ
ncbi:MAG: hypothetical protein P1V35_00090 [Planctomycetota bacterium]|nr:hypothetical protein [Planctomycetota bacterium]